MDFDDKTRRGDQGTVSYDFEFSQQLGYMRQALEDYEDTSPVSLSFPVHPALPDGAVCPSAYRYSPLGSHKNIRLINLEPASSSADMLRCKIEIAELEQARQTYDALSYVWGQARFSSCLYIDSGSQVQDTVLRVTPNLAVALRRLRSASQRRIIWADAVCIDQENGLEKAHQVDMMAQIYRSARCVCVYLGQGVPEVEQCMEFIWSLAYLSTLKEGGLVSHDASENSTMVRAALQTTFGTDDFRPVCAFLELPWFKRRWVVQEAASRVAVIYLYGSQRISQAHISMVLGMLSNHTYPMDASSIASLQSLALVRKLQRLITESQVFGAPGILHLLVRCHTLKCSDDRDRIYALLRCAADVQGSLISFPEQPISIRSDYNCNPTELYTDLAEKCIRGHYTLDVLNCAGAYKTGTSQALRLPSWVPHWNGTLRYKPFLGCSRFMAGVFSTDLVDRPNIDKGSTMHAPGVCVDRIKSFIRHLPPDPKKVENVLEYIRSHADFLLPDYRKKLVSDQNTRSRFRALALCLVADCAFLPQSDLVDNWSGNWGEENISEVMDSIRNSLISGFGRLPNLGEPKPYKENIQDPIERDHSARMYLTMMCRTMSGRAFFITQNGHIGIGPDDIEAGDQITVLYGCRTPLILRQDELLDTFWIIGDAYVDGFMNGEAADLPEESKRTFSIF
jgi:hypothetical protein